MVKESGGQTLSGARALPGWRLAEQSGITRAENAQSDYGYCECYDNRQDYLGGSVQNRGHDFPPREIAPLAGVGVGKKCRKCHDEHTHQKGRHEK